MKMYLAGFMIGFLLRSLWIGGIVAFLFLLKRLFRHQLTSQTHYHLWHLLLALLAIPFLPVRPMGFPQILPWLGTLNGTAIFHENDSAIPAISHTANITGSMQDLALSVSRKTPSLIGLVLFAIWIGGILCMTISLIGSGLRLRALKKSALPLQNEAIRILYRKCLHEMKIKRDIPIYSTAYLKSPALSGMLKPGIYLPTHLISHGSLEDIRFILLHELQHYKHRDALTAHLMNGARILYWFHPLVRMALREMRSDREIACDASVLQMLEESDYASYGHALLRFAERTSLPSISFAARTSKSMRQMEKRIREIASYHNISPWKKAKSSAALLLTAVMLFGLAPALSTCQAGEGRYMWETSSEQIFQANLSSHFHGYDGSFVLYNPADHAWHIYNMERATLRTSPDSTYKIYDALFALDEGIITPQHSNIDWDHTEYPFQAWNRDQTLGSAMHHSVNWYFQETDRRMGNPTLKKHIEKLGYGNQDLGSDLSSYWLQSSLKISPVEQVSLLAQVFTGKSDFSPEHVQAIKNTLQLSSSPEGKLYGKTGTGRVEEKDISGWFVGMVETGDNAYFFATNIQAPQHATGTKASEITLAALSKLGILTLPSQVIH